jgi:hypothetical protein
MIASRWLEDCPSRDVPWTRRPLIIISAEKGKLAGEIYFNQRNLSRGGGNEHRANDVGGRVVGLNVPGRLQTTTTESKATSFVGVKWHSHRLAHRAAHSRCADLDLSVRRRASRDGEADTVGASAGAGAAPGVHKRSNDREL